jgi:hypothetical protein
MWRTNTNWRPITMFVRRRVFKKHIATENTEGTENMAGHFALGGHYWKLLEIITRQKMKQTGKIQKNLCELCVLCGKRRV